MHALRSVLLLGLVFVPALALSEVIDDLVVMNHDAPFAQAFDVSINDNTGGACANNGMPLPIASCPCSFNSTIPTMAWTYTGSLQGIFSYQPAPGVSGVDAFGYLGYDDATATVCDAANSADITVVINADPQLAAPMVDVKVAEDPADTVIPLGGHFSDSDTALAAPYKDVLSYGAVITLTDNPALFTSVDVTAGTLTLDFAQDQFGTATIQVTATDNRGSLPAIANFVSGNSVSTTFDVVVTPVNDPPVAVDDPDVIDEDTAIVIAVVGNDTDVDGDALTLFSVSTASSGAVIDNLDDTVTYTPAADFNGADSFTYVVSDGNGGTDTGTVNVTVNAVNDAPYVATPLSDGTFNEDDLDQLLDLSIVFDDVDIATDGDLLSYTVDANDNPGLVTITVLGSIATADFQPDQNGAATITFRATDLAGAWITDTVVLTVNAVNDAPVAVIDPAVTDEDTAIVIAVVGNDTDVDGDALTLFSVSTASNGAVVDNLDDTVTYTPAADFNGADSFTYVVSDGNGGTDTGTVNVTVNAVNDAPSVATPLSDGTFDEDDLDQLLDLSIVFDDVDIVTNGDVLSYAVDANDNPGLVTITVLGSIATADFLPDQNGAATVTFRARDLAGASVTDTVVLTVNAVNDPPVAVDDDVVTDEDTAIVIAVVGNDTDVDGDALTLFSVSTASNGAVVDNLDDTVTYTPAADFNGADSFTYLVSDGNGGTDAGTVNVTINPVNDAPVAVDDTAITDEDTAVTFAVIANDTDVDGDTLQVMGTPTSPNGVAIVNPDDTLTFTPSPDFNGITTVSYFVGDGQLPPLADSGVVQVTVNAVNDAPSAVDDFAATDEDVDVTVDVLANDSDIDGDVVAVVGVPTVNVGSVVLNGDDTITWAAPADFHGTVTVNYSIGDGQGPELTANAQVDIIVEPVNDTPFVATPLSDGTFNEDEPDQTRDLSTVFDDVDIATDGDVLSYSLDANDNPGLVTVTVVGSIATADFLPDQNGAATITFRAMDLAGTSVTDTVELTVNPVNDTPFVAASIADVNMNEDELNRTLDLSGTFGDADIATDGDSLTLSVTSVSNLALFDAVSMAGTDLTLDLATDVFGSAFVTVRATDESSVFVEDTFVVSVAPVNDAPVAQDDTAVTDEDVAVTVDVVGNDSDIDGDALSVTGTPSANNGTVGVNGDGTLNYLPDPDFNGADVISYTVGDGQVPELTANAQVSVTVNPVNDAPIAADDNGAVDEDTTVILAVLGNDSDIDGDTLSLVSASGAANGNATANPDGTVSYTPAPDFNGADSFTYVMSDGNGASAGATVSITVNPVNDVPVVRVPISDVNTSEDVDHVVALAGAFDDVDIATNADALTLTVADVGRQNLFDATTIVGTTLTLDVAPNRNGTSSVTVRATDTQGAFVENTFQVRISRVNDAPFVAVPIADVSADEDAPDLVVDLTGVFDDPDIQTDADDLTLTVSGGGSGPLFDSASMAGTNLTLNFAADQNGVADVTIRATDQVGAFVEDTFQVTVNPVNDAPTVATALADRVTDEDVNVAVNLAAAFADVDVATNGDVLSYLVAANDNPALFDTTLISGTMLTLDLAANLHGTATLTIRAADTAGAFVEDSFALTVNSVNDAPSVIAAYGDVSVDEDAPNVVLDLSSVFGDVDVATDGDSFVLSLDGNSNAALFDVVDLTGSTLTLDLAADQNGVTDITIGATDTQGASVTDTFTVTVNAVNDAPLLVAPFNDVTVDEDAVDVLVSLAPHFDDIDFTTNVETLTYSVANTNPAMFAATDIAGDVLNLDFGDHRNGVATLTVRATDTGGAFVEGTFAVTVNPVNDGPYVAQPMPDLTIDEDDPNLVVDLTPVFHDVDLDNEGDVLTYSIITDLGAELFDAVTVSGATLTFDLAAHQFGDAQFTLRVQDSAGLSAQDTFQMFVLPTNDIPVAAADSLTIDEDPGEIVIDVLANDFTEDQPSTVVGAGITIVLDGLLYTNVTESVPTTQINQLGDAVTLPNGTVFINPDFTISYMPKQDFNGSDFFTYTIRDLDGDTSSATVTIQVNALNDAPLGLARTDFTIEENAFLNVLAPGLLLDAFDAEGDAVSLVLQDRPVDGTLLVNPDGSFTYTPDVNFTGSDRFTYFLSDGLTTNEGGPYEVVVQVTPAPPPPVPPPAGEVEFDFQLADQPLELATGTEANVVVLMDDSGSMDWTLSAPDEREGRLLIAGPRANSIYAYVHSLTTNTYNATSDIGRVVPSEEALAGDAAFAGNDYGVWRARSAKYNRVYYNPEVLYLPWRGLNPNNVDFANVDPLNAPLDPMDLNQTIDLSVEVQYSSTLVPRMNGSPTKNLTVFDFYIPRYYATPASGPDLAWNDPHLLVEIRDDGATYQGGEDRIDCEADDGSPFTCTYAQEIQNFANWFSYHRSREYATKSALGRVVADATTIRIGYAALNDANDRIAIDDMNATFRAGAKRALMDQIYSINSNGSTPMRSRLDQTGKYYECKGGNIFNLPASSPGDPACPTPAAPLGQCQLNYTLAFTDGRWNGGMPAQNQDDDDTSNFDGGVFAGSTRGTLADVAMHYYERDLQPDLADEVPTTARDLLWAAPDAFGASSDTMHQHMKTFGIQLGLTGYLDDDDIPTDITQSVDWGDPFLDADAKTDDVRHAALNGRGAFLTAFDPQELQRTMESAFDEFAAGEGAASGVSFNSQQIQEDSLIFRGFYNTKVNTGDLVAQELGADGMPIEPPAWSAAEGLDSKAPGDRVIVTFDSDPSSAGNRTGIPFRYLGMTSEQQATLTAEQVDYLRGDRSNERPQGLNYRERPDVKGLLGDIVNSTPVFVGPPSLLSQDHAKYPVDDGNLYTQFAEANENRREMVVVSANDGMLHIFDANDGEEILGYVPDKIINGEPYANALSQLTSPAYSHKYFADLTPAVNDVFTRARTDLVRKWRTVVVGGLRGGGKGYFALDLTAPSAFATETGAADQVLWEFTDADDVSPDPARLDLQGAPVKDLGYSYSQPTLIMTNAEVGTDPVRQRWAAAFGNGYNSTAGIAKLFALFVEDGVDGWDYATGDFVKVDTGYGAPGPGERNEGRPNALGMPRLVDLDVNGTADLAYAGDLRGNLYRFDLRDTNPDNWTATRVFTATYTQNLEDVPQPITTQPIVIKNPQVEEGLIVIFGTGSWVTVPDATNTDVQSLYGIWDRLEAAPDIDRDDLVEQEITNLVDPAFGNVRTISDYPVDYTPPSTTRGWYVDLDAVRPLTDLAGNPNPDESGNAPPEPQFPGERAIRNLQLRGGFLFVNTIIPRDQTTCLLSPGGFQMAMNPVTGSVGGLSEEIAFDLNNDGNFDDSDNVVTGEVVAGMRFEDAVPTDSSFIGNQRYTQLSNREISVTVTNTQNGDRAGRLSWKEMPAADL